MTRPSDCSVPSDSRRLLVAPCGDGTGGADFPSRCGWCSRPTRRSWCTLSPTPPPGTLKHPNAPGVRLRGESATHGWIIDAYGDYDRDSMILWLWNAQGVHRIEDPRFLPTFYLHAAPADLPEIRRRTEILDGVREVREVSRRIALEDDEAKPVLEIVPRHYRDIRELAHILDSNGGYVDHRLYNVDLRFSQRYAMDHGLFPMGLVRYANGIWTPEEEHFALEYPLPPLKRALLDLHVDNPAGIPRMQDKLLGARIDDVELDGDAESILNGINEVIHSKDPDVLMTDAENLLRGDRGGFTFEPEVGVHEGLYELDFSSLYPSIMVKYNISAETLDCACCPADGLPVPELRYHLCTRRVGIVGRVLKPLIERRRYYKKMKKEPGPLQDVYTGRDTILKWTLVTCLDGRTVIPYKMGDERSQKPISDIIDPLLLDGGMADAPAELRLFGFDSNLRLMEKKVSKVLKVRSPPKMLRVGLRKGREIFVTPRSEERRVGKEC